MQELFPIKLTVSNYRCFSDASPLRLDLTGTIQALIGPNNIGKTAILRFLYEMRPLFQLYGQGRRALEHSNSDRQAFSPLGIVDKEEIFCDKNNRPLTIDISCPNENSLNLPHNILSPNQIRLTIERKGNMPKVEFLVEEQVIASGNIGNATVDNIPVLVSGANRFSVDRILKAVGLLGGARYIPQPRNLLGGIQGQSYCDAAIGASAITRWKDLRSGPSQENRRQIRKIENVIRELLDIEEDFSIEPSSDATHLLVNIGQSSRRLEEVGGGLSQVISIFVNLADQPPTILLLDEPEIGLHPKLQVRFLLAVSRIASHGVLFTTHSLGLARSVGAPVLSLRRNSDGDVISERLHGTKSYAEFLGELSYGSLQEIGFSKVLLVEGPSDLAFFMRLIALQGKQNEVLLMHLGGNSGINTSSQAQMALGEIKRICGNVFCIIDSEKASEECPIDSVRDLFRTICQTMGIKVHITQRRATENYISEYVLKTAISENACVLSPFEKLKESDHKWGKRHILQICSYLSNKELEGTDIWDFIASI